MCGELINLVHHMMTFMAQTLGHFPGAFSLPATFAMFPIKDKRSTSECLEWPLNCPLNAIINRRVNDCHSQEFLFSALL